MIDEKVKKEYLTLLDDIESLMKEKNKLDREVRTFRDQVQKIHGELFLEINLAKDDKGKALYSNERLRETKHRMALSENTEYINLCNKIRELDDKTRDIAIEYNKLIDKKYLLMVELGIPHNPELEQFPGV